MRFARRTPPPMRANASCLPAYDSNGSPICAPKWVVPKIFRLFCSWRGNWPSIAAARFRSECHWALARRLQNAQDDTCASRAGCLSHRCPSTWDPADQTRPQPVYEGTLRRVAACPCARRPDTPNAIGAGSSRPRLHRPPVIWPIAQRNTFHDFGPIWREWRSKPPNRQRCRRRCRGADRLREGRVSSNFVHDYNRVLHSVDNSARVRQ